MSTKLKKKARHVKAIIFKALKVESRAKQKEKRFWDATSHESTVCQHCNVIYERQEYQRCKHEQVKRDQC